MMNKAKFMEKNTTVLVFSKNRAMQLDALLRSYLLHCQDSHRSNIIVLYDTTSSHYQKQYDRLKEIYQGSVCFKLQKKFRKDVLTLISPQQRGVKKWINSFRISLPNWLNGLISTNAKVSPDQYTLFLVDDTVFIRDFYLEDIISVLESQTEIIGFSLRLGDNTTYCYPMQSEQCLPDFTLYRNNFYIFTWYSSNLDFGYPFELSSSLYRSEMIFNYLLQLSFWNPNSLEAKMAGGAWQFHQKYPYLACYKKSVAFSIPVNKVQNEFPNRYGVDYSNSIEELSQRFDEGEVIDINKFTGFVPKACHQEVELSFCKRSDL